MKLNNLNLGKALSKDEQKQVKGGTLYCNAGDIIVCACAGGNVCKSAVGGGVSEGADCQNFCHAGVASGYDGCFSSCPLSGGGPA